MVIHDFYFPGIFIMPNETNSPLIINSDAMLTFSVATHLFQPVTGRNS